MIPLFQHPPNSRSVSRDACRSNKVTFSRTHAARQTPSCHRGESSMMLVADRHFPASVGRPIQQSDSLSLARARSGVLRGRQFQVNVA